MDLTKLDPKSFGADPRYPLGVPINRRSPPPEFVPIKGRPGWWRNGRTGEEKYLAPSASRRERSTGPAGRSRRVLPATMFHLQQLSNFGTSTPAVARTLLQGSKILAFFDAVLTTCRSRDDLHADRRPHRMFAAPCI